MTIYERNDYYSEDEVEYEGFLADRANARALALEYEDRCEEYDRAICTGGVFRGSAMPANAREMGQISEHARKVRTEIERKANSVGLSWKSVHEELRALPERGREKP